VEEESDGKRKLVQGRKDKIRKEIRGRENAKRLDKRTPHPLYCLFHPPGMALRSKL
jgi:hypothetical protein